jgi:hypothetical protein
MVEPFSSIVDVMVSRIMNWKYLIVSTIAVIAFFLFLASAWYDLVDDEFVDIRLDTITIKPEGTQ